MSKDGNGTPTPTPTPTPPPPPPPPPADNSGNEQGGGSADLKFEIGESIAGYKLVSKIDEGGFGQVYKCTKDDKNFYAMKIESNAMEGGSAIKLEINVLQQLTHEFVFPKYITGGRRSKYHYLVLELLGENLKMLKSRSLTPDCWPDGTWSRVGLQCLYALKKLHDNGFVHRDVKPNNFAIGKNNNGVYKSRVILLLDFGLSRKFVVEEKAKTKVTSKTRGTTAKKVDESKKKDKGTSKDVKGGQDGKSTDTKAKAKPSKKGDNHGHSMRTADEDLAPKYKFRIARPHTDFRGTLQYASPNAHDRIELGRADDLTSLMYMVAEMFYELPWSYDDSIPVADMKKQSTFLRLFTDPKTPQRLNQKMVDLLGEIDKNIASCNYYTAPNYDLIYRFFKEAIDKCRIAWESPFDWEVINHGKADDYSNAVRARTSMAKLLEWENPGEFFKIDKWATLKTPSLSHADPPATTPTKQRKPEQKPKEKSLQEVEAGLVKKPEEKAPKVAAEPKGVKSTVKG